VIGPNAISPVTQGGGSATVPQVSVSTPASALTEALAGLAEVTVQPGCVTWSIVPQPEPAALRDPDTGETGVRLEFRTEDGALAGSEHRTATMFTWWDGLPDGIGRGGHGRIVLRTRYRAGQAGPHVLGAGGVGSLTLTVDGIEVAAGRSDVPADPVEAMVRPGEIRAAVDLAAKREAEIEISLLPDDWPQGPVAIRLGIVPAPDGDAMLGEAVEAARTADAAVVVVGSGPTTESEGFDRPGLDLPGRQGELVRPPNPAKPPRSGWPCRAGRSPATTSRPATGSGRRAGRTGAADRGGERPDRRGSERRHAGAHALGGSGRGGRLLLAARAGHG
jgi:beta-glucosidase